MRITFVLPYAGLAGGIRVLAIYAQRLQQRGHRVVVVSTPWTPPGFRGRAKAVMRQWLHKMNLRAQGTIDPSHFDGLDIEHIRIKEQRPVTDADVPDADVVVATWWETAPWVAALSPEKGAKAYFVQDYGAHDGQPMEAVAETWSLPMHHIVISKWLMSLIEKHSGRTDGDYVPNAVDLEQFNAPPRGKQSKPTVGFLYTSAPQKGCDIILKAIEIAAKSIPDLGVVAYGPGGGFGDAPLPARAKFWQFAPDDKLKDIYSACDAWLFASRLEGFGLPILEAMACRTPVIATPAGAAPELLAEGGGMLVKPDDPQDMAAAILRMINLPDAKWREMSESAYNTVSQYTWDDATDLMERAFQTDAAKINRTKSNFLSINRT